MGTSPIHREERADEYHADHHRGAHLSGFAGVLPLFTAGMTGVAAAPSVAHGTLMRVFGSAQ